MISKKERRELKDIGYLIGGNLIDILSENIQEEAGSMLMGMDNIDSDVAYDIIWVAALKELKGSVQN